MTVKMCGTGSRCERHNIELHGYPCYGCHQEWERRSPRVVALIRRQASGRGASVSPAQITQARKQDAEAVSAYHGPHEVDVEKAGPSGPVSRLWNATCLPECGWSHFWLPSRTAAQDAAANHATPTPDETTESEGNR